MNTDKLNMELNSLIDHGIKNKASDILITPSSSPYYRINLELTILKIPPLSKEIITAFIQSLLAQDKYEIFLKELEYTFITTYNQHRLRVNVFYTYQGPSLSIRILPPLKTLEEIATPPTIKDFCNLNRGLVLITGSNNSGKTTTINAIIHHINNNYKKHIVIIEKPIEYLHLSNQSLISQKELGIHSFSYESSIQAAIRENADIILIDELKDYRTMELALYAAVQGCLVFSVFHTRSVTHTLNKFIYSFPSEQRSLIQNTLAIGLEGIVSQALLKRIDGANLQTAFEIMHVNNEIRNLIKDGKFQDIQSVMEKNINSGMITMQDSINNLIKQGIISSEISQQAFTFEKIVESNSSSFNQDSF
jgi:twitching motility protein PilT